MTMMSIETSNYTKSCPFDELKSFNYQSLLSNILEQHWYNVNSILASRDLVVTPLMSSPRSIESSPLHIACSLPSVPVGIVESLLDTYGTSCCLMNDDDGNLPIHIACSTPDIDPLVIQTLLEASPETSKSYPLNVFLGLFFLTHQGTDQFLC